MAAAGEHQGHRSIFTTPLTKTRRLSQCIAGSDRRLVLSVVRDSGNSIKGRGTTMKRLLLVGLAMLVATAAFAGGNPDVKGYISFDQFARVHEIMPAAYTTVNAYVCFGDLDMGLTSASFKLNDVTVDCPGVFAPPSFTNLLDLAIGNYLTGITVTSTTCLPGPDVAVGYVSLFYLGGACCIELQDHPDYPLWITDCNSPAQVDFYFYIADGSVGGADCYYFVIPVEESSWGSIKALYQ
jgi:hypothetical protein